jgi:pimeloyl-ACP methyl ester carboxylesterase
VFGMVGSTPIRTIMLPGLGADARLFDPQRPVLPRLEVPPWLPHHEGETLAEYGRRMATTIDPTEPFYLGGVSFGAMVAQEMARHVPPRAVLLIASCRRGAAIAPHLKYFVRFSGLFPEREFEVGQGLSPVFASKFGTLDPQHEQLLEEMFADSSARFVRWGIAAITDWPGVEGLAVPVHHIHGSADEWIPIQSVQPDQVIPGGGHLINLTHAAEVNAFLAAHLPLAGP